MLTLDIGNFKETYLASGMDDSQTTMDVALGTGANMPAVPSLALLAKGRNLFNLRQGEAVLITNKVSDTFTITRGYSGTTPTTHDAGDLVLYNIFAEHITELNDAYTVLARFITLALGNKDSGVIRTTYSPTTDLQVTQDTGTNMKFKVKAGHAMVTYLPARVETEYTYPSTITPPTSLPRIDLIQIDVDSNIEIIQGDEAASPVPKSADADALGLGTIYLTTGMTQITNGDITDVRVFF